MNTETTYIVVRRVRGRLVTERMTMSRIERLLGPNADTLVKLQALAAGEAYSDTLVTITREVSR